MIGFYWDMIGVGSSVAGMGLYDGSDVPEVVWIGEKGRLMCWLGGYASWVGGNFSMPSTIALGLLAPKYPF